MTRPPDSDLHKRARDLGLHGLAANFESVGNQPWVTDLIAWEEQERARRSLERRLTTAKLGLFKPMADFDFDWPTFIDREQIADLFTLSWIDSATNVVLVGPNGVGKTMIAKNLAHEAIVRGYTARFITASELLNNWWISPEVGSPADDLAGFVVVVGGSDRGSSMSEVMSSGKSAGKGREVGAGTGLR